MAIYISKAVIPAFFLPGDVDNEIHRLSQGFGQATRVLNADPRPDVPHAILATWGAVTLTPLDETTMAALRRGEEIHRGLLADFVGDPIRSARIGLPVYSIGGGPGYLWGANYNDAGKGSLHIIAVDASALGHSQPPTVALAPSAPTPSREASPLYLLPLPSHPLAAETPAEAAPAPTQTTPSAMGDCSKIADVTQRLACYDKSPAAEEAEAMVQCSISSPDGNTQTLSTPYSDCLERSLKTIESDGEIATARGLSRCTIAEVNKVRIWWTTQSNCNAEIAIAKTNANKREAYNKSEDNNKVDKSTNDNADSTQSDSNLSQYEICDGNFTVAGAMTAFAKNSSPDYARGQI